MKRTDWQRSEPVDLTVGDHILRLPCTALLPCSNGVMVTRLRNDSVDRTMLVTAYRELFGDFSVVRKAGTTSSPLLGLTETPYAGPWQPDHDRNLVLWCTAADPNVVPASANAPDRATGPDSGLTKVGTVTWGATTFDGTRAAWFMNSGRLRSPVSASQPACALATGTQKAFSIVMAVNFPAPTANKTLFSLGNTTAGHSSLMSVETSSGPQHRIRRVDTAGGVTNVDCGDVVPAATPYVLAVYFRGRSIIVRVNGVTVKQSAFNRSPIECNRMVFGAQLSGGAEGQIATYYLHEVVARASHDLGALGASFPRDEAYVRAQIGV